MNGIDKRHFSTYRLRMPWAAPNGFGHAGPQLLLGIGVALITFAAVRFQVKSLPPSASVGPGTIPFFF
jgi:hypothetical protein